MAKILSSPQVRINNETFSVVPNSITSELGLGESSVLPQSAGNGKVEPVFSENVETKRGLIKFSVYVTAAQVASVKTLKASKNENFVSLTDPEGFTLVMKNAALVNEPEFNFQNDGQVELEFHGSPIE